MRNRHPAGAWKVSRTDGVAGTRCCPEESLTLFSKQTNRCFCWARPPPGDICKLCKMIFLYLFHLSVHSGIFWNVNFLWMRRKWSIVFCVFGRTDQAGTRPARPGQMGGVARSWIDYNWDALLVSHLWEHSSVFPIVMQRLGYVGQDSGF